MHSVGDIWLWSCFLLTALGAFFIDLRSMMGESGQTSVSVRAAFFRSMAWIALALVFNAGFWLYLLNRDGSAIAMQKGLEFFTSYLMEKSLSVDNLFVILVIFQSFRIPVRLQRRVLLWGVLGAAGLRFAIIFSGIWLVNYFHWLLYVFGGFIFWSGIRMLFIAEKEEDPAKNPILRWVSRHLRMTRELREQHFFVREKGLWWATPLFLVLVMVEFTDVIFATDSIPAVFAITLDPFIVFASNMFAILGLRALYFLLVAAAEKIAFLQIGIALVLILTGLKMLVAYWIMLPVEWLLALIVTILLTTGLIGWIKRK